MARLCLLFLQFMPGSDATICFERLDRWAPLLRDAAQLPGAHIAIEALHSYVLHVTNVPADRLAAFFARTVNPNYENTMISTAQRLRAQGRAEGKVEGKVEGKAEGKVELLLRQLAAKFGPLPDAVTLRIRAATSDDLDNLGLRVLDATSIADVLGGE